MKTLNRRNFVKTAALGTATAGLSGFSLEKDQPPSSEPGHNPRNPMIATAHIHHSVESAQ